MEYIPLKDVTKYAISGAKELAEASHKRLNVRTYGTDNIEVSPMLKFSVYEALKNSVQHSASKSVDAEIRLVKERSGACRLEISDNGPGKPDEYKSEVFRPDKTNIKNPGGMGLYIVKKIARINGGRVWVEDRVHGDYRKGASVVITIPVK
jgi:signal transduction histidine kinase